TEISFPQGITEVPEYTCMGCIHLTKVTLHGKMTSIGKDAFYFCKSLKEVQMPSSMRVIGQEAFRDCEELETLRLNEGLTQLKTDFIRNTPKLTTLYIPSTATKIEKRTFADTYIHIITLPEGITHLPDWLFENAHMTNVNLPTTLTSLGTQVFMHCEQLTKVFLPYGVTAIGQWEFGYTYELREIWMPPTVTSIGGYAFYLSLFGAKNQVTVYGEIGSLAQVYVESNAKSEWIFQEYQYQVPDGATSKAVSLDGFEYVIVDEEAYIVGYTGSVSGRLVIPQTLGGAPVVAIAPYSLPGEYQYLTIPETVTEIDPTAFNAAPNLVDFNFSASNPVYTSGDCSLYKSNGDGKTLVRRAPAAPGTTKTVTGVTEIGDYAFAGNSKLNTISLANTVTKVGGMAFADCSSLYSLTFNRVPEDMDEQALVGYTGTVYSRVDDGTLEEFCKTRAIDFNMYYLIYCLEGDAFFTRRVKAGSLVPNDMDMTDEYRSLDGWYADSNRRKLWNFESDLMPYSNTTIFGYWTSDFTYKTANGEVKITGYQGQKKDLELPSMLGGQPVTGIAAKAFVSNEDVTWGMITIPASVTDIEEGAIVGATGITGDRGYAAEKYANENGIPFTVAKHVLSFDTGNGAPITARQLEANAPLSLPTPIWDNHTFCGWYTSSEYEQEWTETRMPAEDLTLTALWLKVDGVLQLEAFQLTYDENGATIVGYTGTQPEVTVPEKLNGYRVVRIADYAFKGNRSMITLTLPDSVEEIGEYAFSDSALAEITFGSGLKSIGAYAFSKCENLTAVILPSGVKEVKAGLFVGCRNLGTLSMGDQVTQIGESALSGLVSLRTLTLSPNLVSLGDHALAGNVNLTSVTLPAKVKTLGEDVFAGCTSLREILVEKGNSNYQSVEGKLLLSANGKTLIAYALGNTETECAVPAGVTVISDYVFREAQNVTSVSIPASVSRIGTGAFQSAEKLARVTFDGKITAIPAGCFSGCTALTAVVLPEGLMTIGEYAFHQAGLASIIIPASVVAIDETAFYECGQFLLIGEKGSEAESFAARMSYAFKAKGEALPVTQILLPQGIMIYEDSSRKVAADVLPKNAANRALTWAVADPSVALVSAEGVITPVAPGNTVLTVTAGDGSGVTASCVVAVIGNISWSMVPKALTTIEEEAFRNNRNLTAVDLTVSKCTSIGEYAFAGCSELQIIRIPATVKTIAQTAFAGIEDSVIIQAPAGSTAASYAYAHGISCLAQ
ncbi:MAG: leucine-rich repeat protein, partial [Clostridia bacterium]|nr:leucine-rich repeat protein [Clostridia bacterium]